MKNDHGDDIQGELKANFSSNIWYGADNSALYNHLSSKLSDTRRYPEFEAESLKLMLADKLNINKDQLCISNGSIESIYNIAQVFQSKKSLIITPTFSEYHKACTLNNHIIESCTVLKIEDMVNKFHPDLIWICNPNNPTGHIIKHTVLSDLIKKYSQTIFIIDQSYKDFCYEQTLNINAINQSQNLIIIHSFTKRYSIPGLRMGFLASSKSIIQNISKYSIPWSVNTLAIEAAKFILKNDETNLNIEKWLSDTIQFQQKINAIGIFECQPSQTPFFLVRLLIGRASDLKNYLLKYGILIRNANNILNNNSEQIRLITLSEPENELLIEKLIEWKHTL